MDILFAIFGAQNKNILIKEEPSIIELWD